MLLSIEKLIYGGDGLARTPADKDGRSMTVLVPFVLPGERVEAEITLEKPGFARGSVTQFVAASPDRVSAPCPHFQQCGGCHYQHIPYERQLEFKASILRETVQRIAKIELPAQLQLHPSPPFGYRNRTRLQVRTSPDFALGYYRVGSHEFLPVRECPISSALINRVLSRLTELGGCDCPAAIEEIELFSDATDDHLLAWAFCGRDANKRNLIRWAESVRRELPELEGMTFYPSRRRQEDDAPAAAKPLAQSGAAEIRYPVGENEYRVSAGAFFQVNRHLVGDLVHTVIAHASGDLALDLYAGVGLFSTALSKKIHHIFAVEPSLISHADLRHNAPANVKAVQARSEDYLRTKPARKRPDLVIVDPPRAGLGKAVTGSLAQSGVPQMRYVSCDPATLARDLVPLLAAGYRIDAAHLFDFFPQTYHIETVLLLSR